MVITTSTARTTSSVDDDTVAGKLTHPPGCHLGAPRVVDAEEEDGRDGGWQRTLHFSERLKPFACEPFGQQREERGGLGRREKLVHRVDDEPLDGLRSEHPCEPWGEPFRNLVDEVLLVMRKLC
jgi:hypothetical protein